MYGVTISEIARKKRLFQNIFSVRVSKISSANKRWLLSSKARWKGSIYAGLRKPLYVSLYLRNCAVLFSQKMASFKQDMRYFILLLGWFLVLGLAPAAENSTNDHVTLRTLT